ncbi:hypothetical protein FRC12_004321 [Ceratobasidium sp. 428]|nr:hypothetical protein FRC12_004321 [Ceratobasidium sp. 428]
MGLFRNWTSPQRNEARYLEPHETEQSNLQTTPAQAPLLGCVDLDLLLKMHNQAIRYSDLGQLQDSEELHLKVLSTRRQVLGGEHAATLNSMHGLAVTYFEQERLEESEQLNLHVMAIRKRRLGDEHADTLRSMHNLAATYFEQGRLEESEQLDLHVMATRKRKLGDEHVDTLRSMRSLGVTYRKQGRREEAERLELQVMAIRKRKLLPPQRQLEGAGTSFPALSTLSDYQASKPLVRELRDPASGTLTEPRPLLDSPMIVGAQDQDARSRVSAATPISSAFSYLVHHGCADLTTRLDISSCPEAALSGGRFGDVWRGNLRDGIEVAIKCLRLHTVDDVRCKVVKHAARELYYWSKLKHKNVLELLGFAMFQEQLAMISPWMEHGTLDEYIRKHPQVDRWSLCLQASEGLEYIHVAGMNNMLVSTGGIVKLTDFGNSVMTDQSLGFSATCIAGGGTARWMAPELIKREDETVADRSMPADIYAFGMEVMTGRKPYSEYRREPRATLAAVQGEHPRRPGEFPEETRHGNERWNVLVACWNMHPGHRPSAGQLKAMVGAQLQF